MSRVEAMVVFVVGSLFLWNLVSTESAKAQNVSPADKATIDDLVYANRILASSELGILDVWGHVSARSLTNPNHYFISRYVSPGVVTAADIIENDLDSVSVTGRKDEYQERFIHGEIYKARPDVMAVLHAHTPELVVFGVSSVPLYTIGSPLPIFDIRKFNKGMPGIITNPELGKVLAESLGKSPAVLMWGHGVAVTDKSVAGLVSRVNRMRKDAQVQIIAGSLGGKNSSTESAGLTNRWASENSAADIKSEWEGWKAMISKRMANAKPATQQLRSTAEDLVLANKMLASEELGVLDARGEVSARDPVNPNHFYIPRNVSSASATTQDVIEYDLDCTPVGGPRGDQRPEIYIHCSIYAARPDVMAIVHAHTPELVGFSRSSIAYRTVQGGARFIGAGGLSKFDIGGPDLAIDNLQKGKRLAQALGKKPALLLVNHGVVVTDSSLYTVVNRAEDLKLNARMQLQAILLGGKINYVQPLPGTPEKTIAPGENAATPQVPGGNGGGRALDRAWEYWRQMVAGSR